MAADGLITVPSSIGPKETMDRLEKEVTAKGLTIFARVEFSGRQDSHKEFVRKAASDRRENDVHRRSF